MSVGSTTTGSESDSNSNNEAGETADWEDWQEDGEDRKTQCLLCPQVLADPQSASSHCEIEHGFSFPSAVASLGLDFYQTVRLINFIRSSIQDGRPSEEIVGFLQPGAAFLTDDRFLAPTMADDPLLFSFEELLISSDSSKPSEKEFQRTDSAAGPSRPSQSNEAEEETEMLRARVAALTEQLSKLSDFIQSTSLADPTDPPQPSQPPPPPLHPEPAPTAEGDTGYFGSYARVEIHEEMLRDHVRTSSYQRYILNNPAIFRDKLVLDVGCGTGILSMFAARAGARHVYAVDSSDIVEVAKEVIALNALEHVITCIRGKIEEVDLPVDHVEVIVSEWMGYFLLYESMLDSVLIARDRFLAPGGAVVPNLSTMLVLPIAADPEYDPLRFWDKVYGFDMSCVQRHLLPEAQVHTYPPDCALGPPAIFKVFDMESMKVADTEFSAPFELTIRSAGSLAALLTHFDISFQSPGTTVPVSFSTGADATPTHWKQTAFYFDRCVEVAPLDIVKGTITVHRNTDYHRELLVHAELTVSHPSLPPHHFASGNWSVR